MLLARVFFFILTVLEFASGQEVSSGLTGRVTDASGVAVANAAVLAIDLDRGTRWQSATNEDGVYSYPRIPPGTYSLKVESAGFKAAFYPRVALEVNQRGRVDVALQLGTVSESIEVAADVALLQTEVTQVVQW